MDAVCVINDARDTLERESFRLATSHQQENVPQASFKTRTLLKLIVCGVLLTSQSL